MPSLTPQPILSSLIPNRRPSVAINLKKRADVEKLYQDSSDYRLMTPALPFSNTFLPLPRPTPAPLSLSNTNSKSCRSTIHRPASHSAVALRARFASCSGGMCDKRERPPLAETLLLLLAPNGEKRPAFVSAVAPPKLGPGVPNPPAPGAAKVGGGRLLAGANFGRGSPPPPPAGLGDPNPPPAPPPPAFNHENFLGPSERRAV